MLALRAANNPRGARSQVVKADALRRKMHNELQELKGNIRVFARVRPDAQEREVVAVDDEVGTVVVPLGGAQSAFRFDRAFTPRASQEEVFDEVSNFVQSALDGYNVSLFAYGQTGSGKTHTMFGGPGDAEGIIPRSMAQILAAVQGQVEHGWAYELEASFLEVYNEQVRDLLCGEAEREGKKYTIVAGENGRHDVTDLTARGVSSMADVEAMMAEAQKNKAMAKTDMNERSSRSHTVFSMRIAATRSAGTQGQEQRLFGSLHLVDLAGSERLHKSHAEGQRLKETQAINKSLSALTDVFVALSKKAAHVPYRNSKLTFLLQPCLSGDGKALVIANVSPVEASAHESVCTLRFASMVSQCELGKARAPAATTPCRNSPPPAPLGQRAHARAAPARPQRAWPRQRKCTFTDDRQHGPGAGYQAHLDRCCGGAGGRRARARGGRYPRARRVRGDRGHRGTSWCPGGGRVRARQPHVDHALGGGAPPALGARRQQPPGVPAEHRADRRGREDCAQVWDPCPAGVGARRSKEALMLQ